MRPYYRSLIAILAILVTAGCNLPQSTSDHRLATVVAQTQTAIAQPVSATGLPITTNLPPATAVGVASPPATGSVPTKSAPGVTQSVPPTSPAATAVPTNCTNLAKFISETVPDDSPFPPGVQFMKTWILQNVGTCTWTPGYTLVFVRGDQMGGTSPQPLQGTVPPNGTIQIFLPQTAPAAQGSYQGYWMLRDLQGKDFGLGQTADKAFWTKIKVQPGAVAPTTSANTTPTTGNILAGPPTRTWTFDDRQGPFYMGEDFDIAFDFDNGDLLMTAFEPAGDLWRVAERSYIDNFALEAHFVTGPECAQRDGYGMLVRAPSQPDGIIDSGYVFGFNCEGQFRVYRMDGGNYVGLSKWTSHPSLRPGPNQGNTMTIVGQGSRLQLYANNALLIEFDDSTYPGGLFGLMIASAVTEDFEVSVSQISWWDLP